MSFSVVLQGLPWSCVLSKNVRCSHFATSKTFLSSNFVGSGDCRAQRVLRAVKSRFSLQPLGFWRFLCVIIHAGLRTDHPSMCSSYSPEVTRRSHVVIFLQKDVSFFHSPRDTHVYILYRRVFGRVKCRKTSLFAEKSVTVRIIARSLSRVTSLAHFLVSATAGEREKSVLFEALPLRFSEFYHNSNDLARKIFRLA